MDLLLVVASESYQCEDVTDKHGLYYLVKRGRAAQRWQNVDLEKPRLQVSVDEDVKAEEFETRISIALAFIQVPNDVRLNTDQGLQNDILDLCEDIIVVDSSLLKGLPECFEAPFARRLFLLLSVSLIALEFLGLLVH